MRRGLGLEDNFQALLGTLAHAGSSLGALLLSSGSERGNPLQLILDLPPLGLVCVCVMCESLCVAACMYHAQTRIVNKIGKQTLAGNL